MPGPRPIASAAVRDGTTIVRLEPGQLNVSVLNLVRIEETLDTSAAALLP